MLRTNSSALFALTLNTTRTRSLHPKVRSRFQSHAFSRLIFIYDVAGFIPGDPNTFVVQLSDRLAHFAPKLTLDFITEVCAGMSKAAPAQRISCLQYMCPWIRNLAKFCDPSSSLYEHSGARLRDAIRLLVDLTIADEEVRLLVTSLAHHLN